MTKSKKSNKSSSVVETAPPSENKQNDVNDESPENIVSEDGTQPDASGSSRQPTRSERKSRKILEDIAFELVPEICRVVFRRSSNELIAIANPEVYRAVATGAYIIYGTPTIQTPNNPQQYAAAEQFARKRIAELRVSDDNVNNQTSEYLNKSGGQTSESIVEVQEKSIGIENEVALEDIVLKDPVDEKDVDLVMHHTGASRAQAINAIVSANGDVINAIMELS